MAKPEFDIFHNERIYPDADQIFSIKLSCLNDIKDQCTFVLDTNALLVPYSTGSQSLKEIGDIFKKLKEQKRLMVPAQVAREFADNRPKKLGEMFYSITHKQSSIQEITIGQYPLLEGIAEYNEAQEIEKELKALMSRYRKTIGKIADRVKDWTWDDPVSQIYREIFTPDLIFKLNIDHEAVKKDLEYRYLHKIPPGYKDEGKEDSGIGDLLIWLSILEIGKLKKDVVFVSADVKADWYHKSNKSAIYPRFELLAEFQKASENHAFHIIRLSELLEVMGADQQVVSEVQSEERLELENIPQVMAYIAEHAVLNWYKKRYDSVTSQTAASGKAGMLSLTYTSEDGEEIGVDVMLLKDSIGLTLRKLRDDLEKIRHYFVHQGIIVELVLVARSNEYPFDQLKEAIQKKDLKNAVHPFGVLFKVGFLDNESKFCLIDEWTLLN